LLHQPASSGFIVGMAQNSDAPLKLRDGLVWRQVAGEVVVLDTTTSQYLSVNQSGAVLWPLLSNGCRFEELAAALAQHYGLSPEAAAKDAESFIASLTELGVMAK